VESVRDGWWYTALLPAGRRVGVFLTDADLPVARMAARATDFERMLAETIHVGARIAHGGYVLTAGPRGGAASSSRLVPACGEGWVAVGDAAVAFDPLSSQGILTALYGGLRAGEAIDAELKGEAGRVAQASMDLWRVYETYLRNRRRVYEEERRWSDHAFWRRRT
jgi:flavin-dependent dehydrogenase